MAYGWNTTKTANSVIWSVTKTEWCDDLGRARTVAVKTGIETTRPRAVGQAKRWVLYFRKGGQAA